jgi:glyoxylase-like metal-dependent hydrolase (beta-lactamase superfamily II)
VGDGLTIVPAPGHSPGHCYLRVETPDDSGVFTGDSMHHPLQVVARETNSFACADADQARASRRKILEECCEHRRLLVPGHFAPPHCGRISPKGSIFRVAWEGAQ